MKFFPLLRSNSSTPSVRSTFIFLPDILDAQFRFIRGKFDHTVTLDVFNLYAAMYGLGYSWWSGDGVPGGGMVYHHEGWCGVGARY